MESQRQHLANQPAEEDDSGYVTRRFIIDPSRSAAPIMLPNPPPQSPVPSVSSAVPSLSLAQIPQEARTPLLDPFTAVQSTPVSSPVSSVRAAQAPPVPAQTIRPVPAQVQQEQQPQPQPIQPVPAQAVTQQQQPIQQQQPQQQTQQPQQQPTQQQQPQTQQAQAQPKQPQQQAQPQSKQQPQQPKPQQQVQKTTQAQAATPAPQQEHEKGQTTSFSPASHMELQSHQQALNVQKQADQKAVISTAPQMPPQTMPPQAAQPQSKQQPQQQVQKTQQAQQEVSPGTASLQTFAPASPPPPIPSVAPPVSPAPQHTSSFAPVASPPTPMPASAPALVAPPIPPPPIAAPQFTSSFAPVTLPPTQVTSSFTPVTPPIPPPVMLPKTHALARVQPPLPPAPMQPYSQHFLHSVQTLPQKQEGGGQIQHIPQPQLQIAVTAYSKYKLPVIPGIAPRTTLPPGVGLVLEGGGTRGFYSAGVFEAFMDAGIMFPYIAAVSAGAANVLSYVSGQRGRNRLIIERLVSDPRYLSGSNLIKDRSLFNFDFIFKTIPEEYLFWDQQMFDRVQTRLLTGAIDCREGRTIWFEKSQLEPDFMPTIASCSIPLMSKIVRFDNRDLLDGGILDPIPIEKSIADGNNFHVVVLTQNADYIKQPSKIGPLLKMTYRKYPHLIWAIKERHEAYNRQVALAERLEREGRALIIRPHNTVEVSRIESDPEKLLDLHDEGHLDGALAVDKLHQIFKFKM